MKKFLAAMIMVCLSVAFCSAAMAQDANGQPGPAPAAVNQPAPTQAQPATPQAQPYAQPASPQAQRYVQRPQRQRPILRVRPRVGISIGRRVGIGVGVGPVGFHIPL